MINSNINYKEFIRYIHQKFEDDLSLNEVEHILHLEEGYNKDNPTSLGKHLVLNRLIFSGVKEEGDKFCHDQEFHKGINVWIADNQKGKSTTFKVIKFALTGKDSIKPDIKPWITEILLEFSIGHNTYVSFINRTSRDKGALYSFGIEDFKRTLANQKLETVKREKVFEFKNNAQFQEKIQEFFFEHFSFYTLKYTSHKSAKDDFGLTTGNLSWLTYFKSIYLESKNYEYLFFDNEDKGAQGRKIFEMILGLPLTYPINMLGVQRDRVLEKIGEIKLLEKSKVETTKAKKDKISRRYAEVTKELELLKKQTNVVLNDRTLVEEYNNLQNKVNKIRIQERVTNDAYQTEKRKQTLLEEELKNLNSDKAKIEAEINRLTKQELNIELYEEAGSFFSNLDIKSCPHCEIEISNKRKEKEREKHTCSLCGETSNQPKVEISELTEKLDKIKQEKERHSSKLQQVDKAISRQIEDAEILRKSIEGLYAKVISVPSIELDNKRLEEIEVRIESIGKERIAQNELLDKKDQLIRDEAVLKFQLREIEKENTSTSSGNLQKLSLKRDVLSEALKALERKRIQLNKDILGKLEQLVLNEVQAFGLTSINQVEISDKFDLIITQNNVSLGFQDLTEGEKLRVKLAFYLSLIQLDIEHSLGRHPRFLIFDSPGSEEMVPKHLHGLSDILKNVEERFKDKLQIFIGSALREFSEITDKAKVFIKEEDEFIF